MIIVKSNNTTGNITRLDEEINGKYMLKLFTTNNHLYNVNDNNNEVYITRGSPYTINLTNGYYTPTEFKDHLQTQLTSGTGTSFTITKNDNTKKFTTTCASSFSYTFATNTSNSARKLLGLNETDTTSATSLTHTNTWDLTPTKLIFCHIHEDQHKIFNTNNMTASFVISTDVEFGNVIKYPKNSKDIVPIFNFKNTRQLNIDFINIENKSIDLNGQEWMMILEKL